MAIECYLAMTAAEIASAPTLPRYPAYMACHFSPYGPGLSNIPQRLPPGAMLLLTDRTPIHGHDPLLIARQMTAAVEKLGCSRVLLDLQRPGEAETSQVVRELLRHLPCPTGVSQSYAEDLDCPILLPPVPPDGLLQEYLTPWRGREIWLEAAPESLCITVTSTGSRFSPGSFPPDTVGHHDKILHCHYRIESRKDRAVFTLWRSREDLEAHLEEAQALGVTLSLGLYQELGSIWT